MTVVRRDLAHQEFDVHALCRVASARTASGSAIKTQQVCVRSYESRLAVKLAELTEQGNCLLSATWAQGARLRQQRLPPSENTLQRKGATEHPRLF